MEIRLERCLSGRLRDTYPPGEEDLEVRVDSWRSTTELTAVLRTVSERVVLEHPRCRRIVFAVPEGATEIVDAAGEAGFRQVVDVEVEGECYTLLVTEPAWVTAVDMDLDRVPQT